MPETDISLSAEGALSGARRAALIVLAVATAIGSAGLAAGGTAGALLGAELTGTAAGAGLPLGVLVAGSAATALLISRRTGQVGRGRSLMLGYLLGVAGAVLVIAAAVVSSLPALLAGSALVGAANSSVFLSRYAAAEVGGVAARGRALGVVFFATAVGAVSSPSMLGPSGDLAHALGLPRLSGLYVVAVLAFTVAALLLAAVSSPAVPYAGRGAALLGTSQGPTVTRQEAAASLAPVPARLALAVLAATNLVMVAVMAVAPVHLAGHGHGLDLIGIIISVHVAGMFLPSPISGWLADRVGPVPVAAFGLLLLVAAGVAGALADPYSALATTGVLALLGIGWNFGVVGGSTLLAAAVPAALRPRAEGIGEAAMGLAAGAGAPAAGLVVALGDFAALSLVGTAAAALTLGYVQWSRNLERTTRAG